MSNAAKHRIMQYNLSLTIERDEYLKIKNSPQLYRIVDEKSEFTKDNEYIVLLHYIEESNPVCVAPQEEHGVEILNLGIDLERERYEELHETANIEKKSVGFNKRFNCFFAGVHFKAQKISINTTHYPEV